jgi:hypothetical protein
LEKSYKALKVQHKKEIKWNACDLCDDEYTARRLCKFIVAARPG